MSSLSWRSRVLHLADWIVHLAVNWWWVWDLARFWSLAAISEVFCFFYLSKSLPGMTTWWQCWEQHPLGRFSTLLKWPCSALVLIFCNFRVSTRHSTTCMSKMNSSRPAGGSLCKTPFLGVHSMPVPIVRVTNKIWPAWFACLVIEITSAPPD